jgi:hypothetical protein
MANIHFLHNLALVDARAWPGANEGSRDTWQFAGQIKRLLSENPME